MKSDRRLRNATSRINTAIFVNQKQITPHRIWYNRVDKKQLTINQEGLLNDLQLVFDNLVGVTEPICQAIDSAKADMTIFNSSGIKAFVTENNPKYANRIIK